VNWETTANRRITALNCSVSADIQSGYIFRIDVDFDRTIDPVRFIEDHYLGTSGSEESLRRTYEQASGLVFTAPLMLFQRPSDRFGEPALFASAQAHLRLFVTKVEDALQRTSAILRPAVQAETAAATATATATATAKADAIETLANDYFNFPASERDSRNALSGIMTRDTYTKAAHLACLKAMVPEGKITLMSEQEAAMASRPGKRRLGTPPSGGSARRT
jgi:hypothetical protein